MSSEASGEAFINMSTSVTGADYGEAAAKTTRLASLSDLFGIKVRDWACHDRFRTAVLLAKLLGVSSNKQGHTEMGTRS